MRIKWLSVSLAAIMLLFSFCFAVSATPTPVISEISPNQGLDNQQISLTIKGDKFYNAKTTVKLCKVGQSDILATDVVVTDSSITCNVDLKGKALGTWDVVVTNIGKVTKKLRTNSLTGAFTIATSLPSIKSFNPNSAFDDGPANLEVKGSNFRPGATLSLLKNGKVIVAAKNQLSKSGDQLSAEVNLKGVSPDIYDIEVKNTDGTKALMAAAFCVLQNSTPSPTPVATKTVAPTPTPTPTPVTVKPTPADPNSLFKSIYFDFDKSVIRADQTNAIKANLEVVLANKDGVIVLGGHADERGPNNYNIQLSAQRAQSVKAFLVKNGISAKRIIIYAYGETSPKLLGHNEESWQFNRRVDVAIWNQVPTQKDALKK